VCVGGQGCGVDGDSRIGIGLLAPERPPSLGPVTGTNDLLVVMRIFSLFYLFCCTFVHCECVSACRSQWSRKRVAEVIDIELALYPPCVPWRLGARKKCVNLATRKQYSILFTNTLMLEAQLPEVSAQVSAYTRNKQMRAGG
jgi:hypothetical protein